MCKLLVPATGAALAWSSTGLDLHVKQQLCVLFSCLPQEGYLADLLLVEGNPLEDISVLRHPEQRLKLIMKGGRLVKDAV